MAIYTPTDLDFLIDDLRLELNDYTEPYTYEDAVLRHALVMALKALGRRWHYRYSIDDSYTVTRNTKVPFSADEPPVIDRPDERVIVLKAAIIMRLSELSDTVWNIGSWRDDEISVSNIAAGNMFDKMLQREENELEELLKRRLYAGTRQSLPGFRLPMNQREG